MKFLFSLFLLLTVSIILYAVPNEGHVKHFPNTLCLLDKSQATWDVSVTDGDKTWVATSGQINGIDIQNIDSGSYEISWKELGQSLLAVVIIYQSDDLVVPIFRFYQINVYGDLKIIGPEVVCMSDVPKFRVECCDESAPHSIKWDTTGGGRVVDDGDVEVGIKWDYPSGTTNDITITARFGGNVATKNITVIQISSETVFEEPTPRTRTMIGVGEKVNVFVKPSDFSVTWHLNEGDDVGELSEESGNSTVYTSSKTANRAEIQASYNAESICAYEINTIEPSGVFMEFDDDEIAIGKPHTVGIQIKPSVYILPNTVNFSNIKVSEGFAAPIVTGYFDPTYKNANHKATEEPIGLIGFWDPIGTILDEPDEIKLVFGMDEYNPDSAYPLTAGTFSWYIPWYYHYEGVEKKFTDVEQKGEIVILSEKKYKFILSKGGVIKSIDGDPR